MKKLIKFAIDTHFWLAFNALLFVLLTYRLVGLRPNWEVATLLFFATLSIYTLQQQPAVLTWKAAIAHAAFSKETFQTFVFWVSVFAVVFIASFFEQFAIFYLLHLAFLSVLYAFPSSRKFLVLPLRNLPFTKIFLLLYVWISATVIFPLWDNMNNEYFFFLLTAERCFFIFAIGLSFDIRDNAHDLSNQLKTIANQAGMIRTKALALMSLSTASLLAFHLYAPQIASAILLSYLITSLLVIKAGEENNGYYFTGWLDGSMALQWILVTLASFL